MDRKRPQGRQKTVTSGTGGVHKRGSGLGTGPVGSGSAPGGGSSSSGGGGRRSVTRGGGGLIGLVAVVLLLLGGGGGLFGALSGGDTSTDYSATQSAYENIAQTGQTVSGGSGTTSSSGSSGTTAVDTTVAAGSRSKYTELLGDGRDTVTIMVYMCGTDLESKYSMGTKDLLEMTRATLSDQVKIVAYTGGCKKWNNQVVSSSVNQIYEVVNGGLKCVNANAGTGAMTAPATLTSFIQYCTENYPASRNELILWDHGGGSVSGYGYDEKNTRSGSMSLSGINQALKDAGTTFDFIGFDACLMATVENGLMLSSYADYMIASEETEPGIGWYYTGWLTKLSQNTSMPTTEIGANIVNDFVSTCGSECRGQSATLSVVDLAELSNTAPASLKTFSESLSSMIENSEYKQISDARNGSREFAQSSAIDQIDLVDFANRVGTSEGKALSDALLGAVKYNRTSSNMASGSYGLSIYFPYRKSSRVDTAVKTYDAIGMDDSYSKAIQDFAALEVSGQAYAGGSASSFSSLFGSLSGGGSSSVSSGDLNALLGSFLGGDYGSISGLSGSNTGFLSGRSLSTEDTEAYLTGNRFDPAGLTWTGKGGAQVIALPESQWELVEDLALNLFYDDGQGYVDLGLDNVFEFNDDGDLLGSTDRTWLAVNGQTVAYYYEYSDDDGTAYGYIPAMVNGDRVELLVELPADGPGSILGTRSVYLSGETDTVAKSTTALEDGDAIDFLCDYYTYDGTYQDSYYLGDQLTVSGALEVTNVDVGQGDLKVLYRFTDIYQQHYWTEALYQ